MEIKTIIRGEQELFKMEEAKALPLPLQRYKFYKGDLYPFNVINKKETDTNIYWSLTIKTPRFENNRLFYLSKNKSGVTFDKAKKTIKIWFGHNITTLEHDIMPDIIKTFQLDWFSNMSNSLKTLLNNTMLQNCIKGKITNPRDYVKAYLKTSPYKNLDISVELFYKTFSDTRIGSPKSYKKTILYSVNPNESLEYIGRTFNQSSINSTIYDLFNQAELLDRKVNIKWSESRMKEIHKEWTRELMSIAINSIEPVEYNYPELETPEGISLITNNIELFEEGTIMDHCVYTNYEYKVRSKNYFVFRYNRNDVRATVGVTQAVDKIEINQMYSIRNTPVDQEHKDYVSTWLNSEYTRNWFTADNEKVVLIDTNTDWL
jgi:hypothetical protein